MAIGSLEVSQLADLPGPEVVHGTAHNKKEATSSLTATPGNAALTHQPERGRPGLKPGEGHRITHKNITTSQHHRNKHITTASQHTKASHTNKNITSTDADKCSVHTSRTSQSVEGQALSQGQDIAHVCQLAQHHGAFACLRPMCV